MSEEDLQIFLLFQSNLINSRLTVAKLAQKVLIHVFNSWEGQPEYVETSNLRMHDLVIALVRT